MPKFRNVSGHTLEIPAVSKVVDDDGVFDVPDGLVDGFECQPSNYERLDEPKAKAEKESI